MRFALPLLSTLAFVAMHASAAEISVGAGPSCTTHTIADALVLAAATDEIDTIRLADDQPYAEQKVEITTSVNLIGGHANCGSLAPSGRTALVGTGQWATLVIGNTQNRIQVRLERLSISGGGINGDLGFWGGLYVGSNTLAAFADVEIHHNASDAGGGLTIAEGAIVDFERDVDVHDNRAGLGGGVRVHGATLRVRPHGVTIHDNVAYSGGGVAVTGGALMSVGTDIDDRETRVDGVLIAGNIVQGSGGGVYVGGTGSSLLADDMVVRDNVATDGGGVYATTGGYAQFSRFREGPSRHCPDELECLRLSNNRADRGGALSVRYGGIAHVDQTIVRGNGAADGPAFWLDQGSSLRLYASLVVGNDCAESAPDCPTIYTIGSTLRFEHSTFADNAGSDALVLSDDPEGIIASDIQGYSSLVAGKSRLFDFLGPVPAVRYDCILKDRGEQEGDATRSDVLPIAFQNPERGDYHLPGDSAAIDWCDGLPISSQSPDMDGTPRGLDAAKADLFGPYDLGAYESDRIFASGTEPRR
ncbi:hypothetical protein [Dokdonella sp.]|uniref:hypothetical protein n=1 Tax=Dokdonella sp. TaxID=2291710 RepID=UPI001B09591E|nr:hypothetical protein [Dokdonella sp.]MBO9663541.1 hypothetical protein [Dokdonella sp.]